MMKVFALFVLLFCFHAQAAENCSTFDLRGDLGDPRDQGNTGTCYANTTADLATQALKQRISALGVQKSFLTTDENRIVNNSDSDVQDYLRTTPDLISRIKEDRKKEVPSLAPNKLFAYSEKKSRGSSDIKYSGIFDMGGYEDAALMLANEDGFCLDQKLPTNGDPHYTAYSREVQTYARQSAQSQGIPCAADLTSGRLGRVHPEMSAVVMKSFSNWVDQKCGQRVKPPKPLVPKTFTVASDLEDYQKKLKSGELNLKESQKKLFAEIDANLERGRVSAIGYEYNEQTGDKAVEDHSAIIAARKMINGKCRYFLRNSVGKTCDVYAKKFQKSPICEADKGGIWVTPDEIKTLYSVISVK